MSGSYPAQNSKRKINRWICALSLDLGNKAPLGAINSALWASKRQWQLWGAWNDTLAHVNQEISW